MPNYESRWWGYIYDQMMTQDLADLLTETQAFYKSFLEGITGPVLECACGTGLITLPLLSAGFDLYGFDISTSMLDTLKSKASHQGIENIDQRISVQDFERFHYETTFDAIIIPTNSFVHLTTQDAQVRTLKNIYAHLAPQGILLMDLRLAGMRPMVDGSKEGPGRWHTWTHPETGLPFRQRVDGRCDLDSQLMLDHCTIEYEGIMEEFPMTARWIFKEEFQLLLRLGGFSRWETFSTPEKDPLKISFEETQSFWIVYKT